MNNTKISEDTLAAYQDLQAKHKYHYLVLKLTDDLTEIVVESSLGTEEKFDYSGIVQSIIAIPDPRYVVVNFVYQTEDGGPREKILNIFWCPDSAKVKQRMAYASSQNNLKEALVGVHKNIQASDPGDLEEEEIMKRFAGSA